MEMLQSTLSDRWDGSTETRIFPDSSVRTLRRLSLAPSSSRPRPTSFNAQAEATHNVRSESRPRQFRDRPLSARLRCPIAAGGREGSRSICLQRRHFDGWRPVAADPEDHESGPCHPRSGLQWRRPLHRSPFHCQLRYSLEGARRFEQPVPLS